MVSQSRPRSFMVRPPILYVVGQLAAGGLERQLWYLLSAIDREKYSPAVAVWNLDANAMYVKDLRRLGVPIYGLERRGGAVARTIRLRRLVKAIQPDVIHSYTLHTNFPAWVAGKGLASVIVGSLRNDYWMDRREFGLLRASLSCRFPRHLIANSERAQRAAQAHRSLTAPREVSFVPNAIDLRNYTVAPMPDSSRFEIVGIGRFYPQKAWEDMLHALAVFRTSTRIPWRFRLFGEGALGEELRRLCHVLPLSGHVEFPGLCQRVPDVIASAHVVALSSRYEGTPNVVLEALAGGRAVVSTAVGDVPRLVRNGEQGYVVPVGDVRGLADRLLRLANDQELVARFGRAARDRAALEPDPVRLMESTLAIYRKEGWRGEIAKERVSHKESEEDEGCLGSVW